MLVVYCAVCASSVLTLGDLTSLGTETPKVGLPIGDFEKKESAVVTSKDSSMLREKTTEEGKELLVNLVTTLNACFPDYDFRCVSLYHHLKHHKQEEFFAKRFEIFFS